jgi:hypothetical protein
LLTLYNTGARVDPSTLGLPLEQLLLHGIVLLEGAGRRLGLRGGARWQKNTLTVDAFGRSRRALYIIKRAT